MTTFSLLFALCGFAYFVFVPRVFDWFSVAYVSACVYMLPVFIGYSNGAGGELPMHFQTSLTCLMVMAAIVCGAFVLDTNARGTNQECLSDRRTDGLAFALTLLQFIGMVGTCIISGRALLSTSKHEMFETMTIWWLFWKTGVVAAATFSFASRMHRLMMFNFLSLLLLWFLGTRSPLTLSLFSIIVISVSRRGRKPIVGNWKLGLGAFLIGFVVLVYKRIYIFVKAGQWDDVQAVLNSDSVVSDTILTSEAMSQTHLLNVVITDDYRIPFGSHFRDTIVQSFLSGGAKSGDPSFGAGIANDLFPELKYGLASNIWAEMYSSGGWAVLGMFLVIYVGVLGWASAKVRDGFILPVSLICAWMPYWAFYIHRSDTYRLFSHLKQYIALLVISIPFTLIMRVFLRPRIEHRLRTRGPASTSSRGVVLNR